MLPRLILLAILPLVVWPAAQGQTITVLHIKVTLADADGTATPVPRHALLISDNPATAPPRRIVTGLDGTAAANLRPGNYTVESERPVAFGGKAYQWTQIVDVVAGRDAVLELTVKNAEVESAAASTDTATAAAPLEADSSFLLPRWQDSVVALWTPYTHASGFVIDTRGLIATNQRAVGTATSVEVQFSSTTKMQANVLASDPGHNVAILWIDAKAIASVRPVPLACSQAERPHVSDGQEIFAIGVPLGQPKGMTSGVVSHADAHGIASDLVLSPDSAGGPVFTADGLVIGLTSVAQDQDAARRGDTSVVRIEDACAVVASAEKKMKDTAPPSGANLPVEPAKPFPVDALKDAMQRRAGSLSGYQMAAADFDVTFITPVLSYAAQYQVEQGRGREGGDMFANTPQTLARPLLDFSNWAQYVDSFPPVLLIRVTPKLVEGFWTTVARGAARTQGVALPPIKHFKSGFSRLRAYCGAAEVTPIHPFKLEQRVSDSEAIYEGLYAFDPGALGPACGTVKLVLYSEKEPEKGDSRVVDSRLVQQIWEDFASYRSLSR
jgi:S1-C subfamily serine protease